MSASGLAGRRALVTGASRGIGRATAEALAAEGVRVAINYVRSDADAAAAAAAVASRGVDVEVVKADVADPQAVAAMFDHLKRCWGGVDILVNNAAVTHDAYLMMLSDRGWDEVLATNLRGAFLCCRQAVRAMIAGRWGRIVNVVSPAGLLGKDGAANYAASKGGLLSMGKSLAREVARYGITVNAVCPGLVDTHLVATMPAAARDQFLRQIPLSRFGTSDEVAAAIVFLASEPARYITGATLTVDGGLTMIG
jgi:3-oxoacyl-[acyl-carrier protein] reductase